MCDIKHTISNIEESFTVKVYNELDHDFIYYFFNIGDDHKIVEADEIDRLPYKASKIMVMNWEAVLLYLVASYNSKERISDIIDCYHSILDSIEKIYINDSDPSGYLILLHKYLNQRDPNQILRGDVIEHEYKNNHNSLMFIWDTDKILFLRSFDDYDTVNDNMKVITQFPINYWYNTLDRCPVLYIEPYNMDILNIDFNVNYVINYDTDQLILELKDYGTKIIPKDEYEHDVCDKLSVITVRDKFSEVGYTHILIKSDDFKDTQELVKNFMAVKSTCENYDISDFLLVSKSAVSCSNLYNQRLQSIKKMIHSCFVGSIPNVLIDMIGEYIS